MTKTELQFVVEVLKSCRAEFVAMEDTYDDYVVSGPLLEELDEAITILEGEK